MIKGRTERQISKNSWKTCTNVKRYLRCRKRELTLINSWRKGKSKQNTINFKPDQKALSVDRECTQWWHDGSAWFKFSEFFKYSWRFKNPINGSVIWLSGTIFGDVACLLYLKVNGNVMQKLNVFELLKSNALQAWHWVWHQECPAPCLTFIYMDHDHKTST